MNRPSSFFRIGAVALLASAFGGAAARAAVPVVDVVYLEVGPEAVSQTRALLARTAAAARGTGGNQGFVALQRDGLPTQFMMLSLWTDQAALTAYTRSPAVKAEKARLDPSLIGPYDDRPNVPVVDDAARDQAALASAGPQTRIAVTHIDLIPDALKAGIAAAREMALTSATQAGVVTFDLLNQASRANHFVSLGVWQTPQALVAYKNQPFVRAFRDQLPLSGCVYDERIYHVIQ